MAGPDNPNPEAQPTTTGFRPDVPAPLPEFQTGLGLPPKPQYNPKEHEAKTAQYLAYTLMAILGASVLIQYAALGILICYGRIEAIPNFEHLFNAWLPVIAGLVSSAVTYYLTKERK